jgi:hypothetical protein
MNINPADELPGMRPARWPCRPLLSLTLMQGTDIYTAFRAWLLRGA